MMVPTFFYIFNCIAKRRTCGSIMNQLLLKGQCSRHVSRQSSYLNLPIFGQESKVYHNNLQTRLSLHAATSMAGKYVSNKTWVALILPIFLLTYIILSFSGGNAFLVEKSNQENYDHPMKTGPRMDEVVALSGLARITFESMVREEWVHPVYKVGFFLTSAAHKTKTQGKRKLNESRMPLGLYRYRPEYQKIAETFDTTFSDTDTILILGCKQ